LKRDKFCQVITDARAMLITSNLVLRQVKIVLANSGTPNSCAILYSICTISMHRTSFGASKGRLPLVRRAWQPSC
jgi:hypothetical protein